MMDCIAPSRVALSSKFVQSTWYDVVIKSAYSIAARLGAAQMTKIGTRISPVASTPDEFASFIDADIAKWSRVVRDAALQRQ
jgi:tripartite-type tricarboxylate transporter receptor subunit TctC